MACMEHWCVDCDYATFNNNSREPSVCPECGGEMRHQWDEEYDHYDD